MLRFCSTIVRVDQYLLHFTKKYWLNFKQIQIKYDLFISFLKYFIIIVFLFTAIIIPYIIYIFILHKVIQLIKIVYPSGQGF